MIIAFGVACGGDSESEPPPLSACETGSNPNVNFTASFTDLDDIDHIEPLGEVQAFHNYSAHSYVFIKAGVTEVPVYAPADMDLINVTDDGADFGLMFRASCEVVLRFGHITNPITSIRNLATNQGISMFEGQPPTLLQVSAGELIGTTSGTVQAKSFDFGVYHSERPQTFVNNERFHPVETFRYSSCPYDYYSGALRNQMYDLFGPKPLAQPLDCRGPRGVTGTIAGPWFDTEEVFSTPYFGQTEFSPLVVATALNGTVKIIRGTEPNVYRIDLGAASYADPEQVTSEHCYELSTGGYFYLQLQPDGTLHVVRETVGSCPSEFPTSGFTVYYR
ncbi:hypothetical protein [Flagellimonas allohymeniacidonis]|uniref:Uncharacterized protein n=1 Tax=Flagellimonas allohymeniacidonis TaxID=2517819 RepID=A0A4Q8QDP3_9FLAO|nr:hypothetical protein [Allomuricauda hymeniacidonis]TAI48525.1 hypothetical protein EW142_01605 [Allomuricauda hymeniacidonis]